MMTEHEKPVDKIVLFVDILYQVPFWQERVRHFVIEHFKESAKQAGFSGIDAHIVAIIAWSIYNSGVNDKVALRKILFNVNLDLEWYFCFNKEKE